MPVGRTFHTTIVDDGQELWLKPEFGVRAAAAQEETSSRTEVLPAGTRVVVQVL